MKVEPCKQIDAVEVKPWTMKEGVVIEYKIDNILWIMKTNNNKTKTVDKINNNFKKPIERNIKQNYFIKWLNKNKQAGDVFSIEEFYREHPKHKKDVGCRGRMDKTLSNLIKEGKIDQWVNKDEFKVLK